MKPSRPATRTKNTAPPGQQHPLVLVVDDYQDAREMLAQYLEYCGYRVVQAADGQAAITRAAELTPSVILMDLSLPVMDGWEATRRLKHDPRTRAIPVVVFSGYAQAGYYELARSAGCDGFVTKPCLPEALVREIKRVMDAPPPDRPPMAARPG